VRVLATRAALRYTLLQVCAPSGRSLPGAPAPPEARFFVNEDSIQLKKGPSYV